MPAGRSLGSRLLYRSLIAVLLLAAMLFVPARSLKFWQAWAFILVNLAFQFSLITCFLRRDPQLLERRLLRKEKNPRQKILMLFLRMALGAGYVLAGCDHRFGFSRSIWPVPLWLTLLALLLLSAGYFLFFRVLDANRFAASIIQVETGQSVISAGPYRFVRHPMYLAIATTLLFTPLALGSFVALPFFLLGIPALALRLLNEEEILRRELPGYSEYCLRTPHRLIPFVW